MRLEMKRAILNEALSRRPDKPLYHYTGQSGLLGIIRDKQIWATHTQYLNDRREYVHALDLVSKEIDELLATADHQSRSILQEMKGGLSGIESINVCVCSFSEDRDSLSQWRAYGAGMSGFAIGFTGDFLGAAIEKKQWYLARCIYDPTDQRALIRSLVEEVFDQNVERLRAANTEEEYLPPGGNLRAYLHRYAPILKDRSFHEEQEWRVISRPLFRSSELFDFRQGSSLLIPYYKFPLADEEFPFHVHEVVVGPTLHEQQSKMSVKSFLVRHKLEYVPVELSSIPYRNW
ncbi:MAG TPA: DUF2971 domain-containing protein [Terriglobales bacterium]|jgi:hypothetical protein